MQDSREKGAGMRDQEPPFQTLLKQHAPQPRFPRNYKLLGLPTETCCRCNYTRKWLDYQIVSDKDSAR